MNIRICDYCGDRKNLHTIPLTRRPNDETIQAELCEQCIADIVRMSTPEPSQQVSTKTNAPLSKIAEQIGKPKGTPLAGPDSKKHHEHDYREGKKDGKYGLFCECGAPEPQDNKEKT